MAKTRCESCDRNFKNEEALKMHKIAKHSPNSNSISKTNNKDEKNTSKLSTKSIMIVIAVLILLIAGYFMANYFFTPGEYDPFAQCITDSGAKFYGAYWCPHCNEQKELFGKSKKLLPYVECSLPNRGGQSIICNSAFIESYPTWIFEDGSKQEGLMTFEQLTEKTGCSIVEDN